MVKNQRSYLTRDELKSFLDYDGETGVFTWKSREPKNERTVKIWNTRFAGKLAGHLSRGYIHIRLLGLLYPAHRLAWLYVYGEHPAGIIDHISHVSTDNRIGNLRDVDAEENAHNRNMHRNCQTGVQGVRFNERYGQWTAGIWSKGRNYYLGRFRAFDDAVEARKAAELKFGYHPNHGVNPT